ncbi:MAG: GHKL domain-containing protein, partial [Oscillospiraceae bacterium]|nr:GHKL domain-containing protein [Oscillospiraceae bacterium]
IELETKFLNNHIYLNVKNDYSGELKKDSDGRYISTKPNGSGLGLKSVNALLKAHNGFLAIEDNNGVFNLLASMKN